MRCACGRTAWDTAGFFAARLTKTEKPAGSSQAVTGGCRLRQAIPIYGCQHREQKTLAGIT